MAGRGYRFAHAVAQDRDDVPALPPPQGVPQPATSFVGRASELHEVEIELEATRLLTLVGVGGIGKTRLAIELATKVASRFPHGVAFVELAPLEDPRAVVGTIAAALGVAPDATHSPVDALLQHLAQRTQLVVLDNCEHLLGASALLATQLLRACPGVKLLATSREALRVAGEAVYQVPPLSVPDAGSDLAPEVLRDSPSVALFVARASALDRGFTLTSDNAADIAAICRKVDGIPLAIELAASRVRAMSVKTIAAHLNEQFRLLVGGDRSALPRQHTMRATLEWSYRLLGEPERSVFRRLSVFAGGFEVDAAEAVGASNGVSAADVLYLLAELVDKSLIAFDPSLNRYRMLEPVRQYAQERLVEAGEEAGTCDRHLQFHEALAERAQRELAGPHRDAWLARLDAERENILLAFAHARRAPEGGSAGLRMAHALLMWMTYREVELWYGVVLQALAHPDAQQEDLARCRALYAAASMCNLTGRGVEGFALAQSSVKVARACGDVPALAESLVRLGYAAIESDRTADAFEYYLEGLALARQMDNHNLIAGCLGGLGEIHSLQDRFDLAEAAYLEALAIARGSTGDDSVVLANLARNAIALRAESKAIRYLREIVAISKGKFEHYITATLLRTFAGLAALRGEWAQALRWYGAATAFEEKHNLFDAVDARFHARSMCTAREAMGADPADAAFAAGRALGSDAAIREAEAWLEALPLA
ncbi:MAG: AAA family ATPase [Betaproteobacteria bacterium]|nr:AAA family ATPase [Betaproteobacteria bacterium]